MASPPFLYLGGRANSTTPGCRSSSTTRSIRPTWKPQSPPVSVRLIVEIKKNRPILTGGFLFLRSAIRRCQIAATTTPHGGAAPRRRSVTAEMDCCRNRQRRWRLPEPRPVQVRPQSIRRDHPPNHLGDGVRPGVRDGGGVALRRAADPRGPHPAAARPIRLLLI